MTMGLRLLLPILLIWSTLTTAKYYGHSGLPFPLEQAKTSGNIKEIDLISLLDLLSRNEFWRGFLLGLRESLQMDIDFFRTCKNKIPNIINNLADIVVILRNFKMDDWKSDLEKLAADIIKLTGDSFPCLFFVQGIYGILKLIIDPKVSALEHHLIINLTIFSKKFYEDTIDIVENIVIGNSYEIGYDFGQMLYLLIR